MIELVDMCSLQAPERVDFNKMRDSGIRGVYFKASQYSASIDPTFHPGVERARKAGLICGAYHFCFCGSDPSLQMEHFFKASAGLGSNPGELPPMVDWEYSKNGLDGQPIRLSDSCKWALAAMEAAEALWYPDVDRLPTLYTYPYFAQERQPFLASVGGLARFPLTLAAYPNLVTPPKPWDRVTIHQYVGNGGRVPGVATDCDRDRFLGSEDDFQRFIGNTVPTGNKLVKDESETGSGGIIHDLNYPHVYEQRMCGAV